MVTIDQNYTYQQYEQALQQAAQLGFKGLKAHDYALAHTDILYQAELPEITVTPNKHIYDDPGGNRVTYNDYLARQSTGTGYDQLGNVVGGAIALPMLVTAGAPVLGGVVGDYAALQAAHPVAFGIADDLLTIDGIRNALSNNGIAKTVNFAKDGNYKRAVLSGAADVLDLTGGYGAVSRRVKQFMPNLRTAVYNNLVPWGYGWSAHVKDLKNTARDFGEAFVTGSQINPQSTSTSVLGDAGRRQMLRDRLGIVTDTPGPYKIDATTKDGTHIMHYDGSTDFTSLRSDFRTMQDYWLRHKSVGDELSRTGGNVGFREDWMGNLHMFDRWDTLPFLKASNFVSMLPGANTHRSIVDLGYKIHSHLPKKIKNWDPLDLISVRPAPIQYNVFPKDATSLKDFEDASSAYNKANAEKIRAMWEKRGGSINYLNLFK